MSDAPFLCYRELIPPTSIDVSAFFKCHDTSIPSDEKFLCTATSSSISIYKVNSIKDSTKSVSLSACLHLKLFGKPQDITIYENDDNDLILLSLDSGKVVVIRYNSISNELIPIWMCNAEENAQGVGAEIHSALQVCQTVGMEVCFTRVCTKIQMACTVMYGQQLLFVPMVDVLHLNNGNAVGAVSSAVSTVSPHFVIDVLSIGLAGPIIDSCFISGYSKPAFAILRASGQLPVGHACKVRHTYSLTVVAVDTITKSAAVLWQQDDLPSDCVCLVPLSHPQFCGAVGVVSLNAVLVVAQEGVVGIAVNGFADTTVSPRHDLQSWESSDGESAGLELDASRWIEEGRSPQTQVLVGVLKSGVVLRVAIALNGELMSISSLIFTAEIIASTSPRCSSFSTCPSDRTLWFLGFRQSDSLLVRADVTSRGVTAVHRPKISFKFEQTGSSIKAKSGGNSGSLSSKRRRRFTNSFIDAEDFCRSSTKEDQDEEEQQIEEEEKLLYGSVLEIAAEEKSLTIESFDYLLNLMDTVFVVGPVLDGMFCRPDAKFTRSDAIDWDYDASKRSAANGGLAQVASTGNSSSAASYVAERESKDTWQLSAGLDEGASLYRVYSGLSLSKITSRNFIGASNIFTFTTTSASLTFTVLLVSYEGARSRVFHCWEGESKVKTKAATSSSIAPVVPELRLKEVGVESGFCLSTITLSVGVVQHIPGPVNLTWAVQIFPKGLRLVSLSPAWTGPQESVSVQEMLASDALSAGGLGCRVDEAVVSGQVNAGGWVALLTNQCSLILLQFNSASRRLEVRHERRFSELLSSTSVAHVVEGDAAMDVEVSGERTALDAALSSVVVSASLYHGYLDIGRYVPSVQTSETQVKAEGDAVSLRDQQLEEERLLYGSVLPDSETEEVEIGVSEGNGENASVLGVDSQRQTTVPAIVAQEQSFLVVTQVSGALTVLRLNDMKAVFSTLKFTQLVSSIVCSGEEETVTVDPSDLSTIVETRLARIGRTDSPLVTTSLCLVVLLHSGDLVTYCAKEVDGVVFAWNKTDSRCIFNTRRSLKARLKLQRGVSDASVGLDSTIILDENETPPAISSASLGAEYISYLCSAEGQRSRDEQVLSVVDNLSGRSGVLVSANEPLFIAGDRGLPHVLPLGMPEIPFVNFGRYCALPLRAGGINAVATLWCDLEEADYIRSVTGDAVVRTGRTATLSIYQEVPDLQLYPNSGVSTKKVHVGKTVHRCAEILRRTDDKTEMALLEKRTFVMSCSETTTRPFIPTVLTAEETLREDVLYERYLTSLDSFCQPNPELGPAPLLNERSHSLTIVQGDAAVDTYSLPPNETILDMQVVYLTLERVVVPATSFSSAIKTSERRVFVIASTSLADRRGEDTQGAGRLLLFGLDYALFQEDASAANDNATSETVNGSDPASDGSEVTGSEGVASSAKDKGDAPIASKITGTAQSAATAKFLGSIRPKLKLLWSGPGPASVVRQMGEFVLSTVGSAVFVYKMNAVSMELEQVAFHFAQFYITSISVAKNYIMLADMFHSVQFLVWRESDCSLTQVSKDYEDCTAISTTFVGDGHKLGMLMGDDEGNVQLLQQNPKKLESNKGTRLLCLADFHVGSDVSLLHAHELLSADARKLPPVINMMGMISPPPPPPRTRKGSNFSLQPFGVRFNKSASMPSAIKMGAMVGTMDGGVGLLVPVDERIYRRLALLQQIMAITVQSPLALNPRDFRTFKSSRFRANKKKGVLDGCLLWSFCSLHPSMQDELAAAVGSTAYLIRENLHEIEYVTNFF